MSEPMDFSCERPELTLDASNELSSLLRHFASGENVLATLVVGEDGVLIESTLTSQFESVMLGALASDIFNRCLSFIHDLKLDYNDLTECVFVATDACFRIFPFGGGLVVMVMRKLPGDDDGESD